MKVLKSHLYFLSILLLSSCEEVIELDLPEADKRLVVDSWLHNLSDMQTVKLRLTGPYFDNTATPAVEGALVTVFEDNGNEYKFLEEEPGVYRASFVPQVANSYTLEIITSDGVEYISKAERMNPVPALEDIYFEYKPKALFEEEGYYVFIGLMDPAGIKNFYRWKYYVNGVLQNSPDYFVIQNDDLIDGADLFDIQFNFEPLEVGDHVRIEQYALSENAFDFLSILREQVTSGRGTFDAPPAPIRGNIINKNNPDENVLGYFGISDIDFQEITIEEFE